MTIIKEDDTIISTDMNNEFIKDDKYTQISLLGIIKGKAIKEWHIPVTM